MEELETVDLGRDMQGEIAELVELFPDITPGGLPDKVWVTAREGRRLALAYALYQLAALAEELKAVRGRQRTPGTAQSADSMNPVGTVAAYWDAYQI